MAENVTKLKKETDIQLQEAQKVPKKVNPNRVTLRHIIIKMEKVKERLLKATREKQRGNYQGTPIRLSSVDFSTEVREWQDLFKIKILKWKNLQPRMLYLTRLSLIIGEREYLRQVKTKIIHQY